MQIYALLKMRFCCELFAFSVSHYGTGRSSCALFYCTLRPSRSLSPVGGFCNPFFLWYAYFMWKRLIAVIRNTHFFSSISFAVISSRTRLILFALERQLAPSLQVIAFLCQLFSYCKHFLTNTFCTVGSTRKYEFGWLNPDPCSENGSLCIRRWNTLI